MSALDTLQGLSNTVSQGTGALNRLGSDVGLGRNVSAASWFAQLQPASYKGVPFGVISGDIRFGRRNALHEYPYRDTVWVEDLGRSARRISLSGFIVENGVSTPGPVIAQRDKLIGKCEEVGGGELVHPTMGRLMVSLMDASSRERRDLGRVFELDFTFIEAGKRSFPGVTPATGAAVMAAAAAADNASAADYVKRALSALQKGAAVVNQAVSTAAFWARKAQNIANDATNLVNLSKTLKGSFGRGYNLQSVQTSARTVHDLAAAGSVARDRVAQASASLSSSASDLGV